MLATKKQLFALYCITGKDYRESDISMEDASKIIAESQKTNPKSPKDMAEVEHDIYNHLLENHDRILDVFNKEMSIDSILTQEYYTVGKDGESEHVKQNFAFFGSGCGISWVEFDRRSTICKRLFDSQEGGVHRKAIQRYKTYFINHLDRKVYDYFKSVGFSVEATMGQNMVINDFILNLVVKYLIDRFKLTKVRVKTVID